MFISCVRFENFPCFCNRSIFNSSLLFSSLLNKESSCICLFILVLILNTYRYAEIEKKGQLLSSDDLEKAIHNLQKEYEGLCVPGDKEAVEDVKLDISMQKECLNMLEKQEDALNEMLKQNK